MSTSMPFQTIGAQWALLPDGWHQNICIELDQSGTIVGLSSLGDQQTDIVLEVTVPGMINVHSHAFQRRLLGRTQRFGKPNDDFWSWRTAMYADVDRLTPQDQLEVSSSLFQELVNHGYTTVCEFHYAHGVQDKNSAEIPFLMSEAVINASQSVGIRLLLLPVLYQLGGFGERPPSREQRSFVMETEVFLGLMDHLKEIYPDNPLVSFGYAPHSLRAVEYDAIAALLEHREQTFPDSAVHIHVSEQVREVNESVLGRGTTPIDWLFSNFSPDDKWCFIHATHATKGELKKIVQAQVTIGLCPTTEGDLGDGTFPHAEFLAAGGRLAIGSDSNVCVAPTEELRLIDYQARMASRKRNAFKLDGSVGSGTYLYQTALEGGRRASGLAVGRIEVGSKADLVELTQNHPLTTGKSPDEILNTFVYGGTKELIDRVVINGSIVNR